MRFYSVWAMPTGAQAEPYQRVIEALALPANAPIFHPHITLGSVDHDIDLETYADGISSVMAEPLSVETEAVFTRALFVRFETSDWLRTLRERLEVRPGFTSSRVFNPHISLCYGRVPDGAQHQPEVKALLNQSIKLSRLALMEINLPVETYEDVRAWREIAALELI